MGPEPKKRLKPSILEEAKYAPGCGLLFSQSHRSEVARSVLFDLNLTDHHTHTYDQCIGEWVRDIILNHGNIETVFGTEMYTMSVSNYRFVRGSMLPSDAHARNSSYVGDVMVDVHEYTMTKKDTGVPSMHTEFPFVEKDVVHNGVHLCSFPLMLHSSSCHFAEGCDLSGRSEPEYAGGFIVKGKRRFIPLLKSIMNNYPFRFYNRNRDVYTIHVRSEHLDRKHRSTSTLEIFLDGNKTRRSAVFHNVSVKIPFLSPVVPLSILVSALGCTMSEFEAHVQTSVGKDWDPLLFRSYFITLRHDHRGCTTQQGALFYIGALYGKKDELSVAEGVLKNEVLPHLNDQPGDGCKVFYLAYIYGLLVLFKEGRLEKTDRDQRVYTRLVDSGTSVAVLFRMLFLTFMKQCVKITRRMLTREKKVNVLKIYNHRRLTQKLVSAIATGTWSNKRKGVSHPMTTTNQQAIISQLRRISSSYLNNDGKHISPRMVRGGAYGYECAAETPEGEACGLVYSLACTCRVTRSSNADVLMECLLTSVGDIVVPHAGPGSIVTRDAYKIFDPHGRFVGWCTKIGVLVERFLAMRRCLAIDPFAGMYRDDTLREWRVYCDMGRMVRPLLVVSNLYKVPDIIARAAKGTSIIPELMVNGCIEYVCPSEECALKTTFTIPSSPYDECGYSHLEITDVSFVGIVAALSPFFRHNQGPRLVYWAGMSKQAITSNSHYDIGSATSHNLWYGQKPAVATQTSRDLNMDQITDCVNVTIILYPHSANQEDAIVMNRASVERGMFISDSVRTYMSERHGGLSESSSDRFECPEKNKVFGIKNADYGKIGECGFPSVKQNVCGGDVIIGKTVPSKKLSSTAMANAPANVRSNEYQKKRKDKSVQVRDGEGGAVHSVMLAHRPDCDVAKVRVRSLRVPEIGDKFSMRGSAQVLTDDGWVRLDHIDVSKHRVATLVDGKYLDYTLPSGLSVYNYDGDMYVLRTPTMYVYVTKNHKLYVRFHGRSVFTLERTRDVYGKGVTHKKNCDLRFGDVPGIDLCCGRVAPMDLWLPVLGLFVTGRIVGNADVFTLESPLEGEATSLSSVFSAYGDCVCIRSHARYCHVRVLCPSLLSTLEGLVSSVGLPRYVWSLSRRQCRVLLCAMVKDVSHVYRVSDIRISDDVTRLAFHAGVCSDVSHRGSVIDVTLSGGCVSGDGSACLCGYVSEDAGVSSEYYEHYSGDVYCLEIPDTHTHVYYAREGAGHPPYWTGNSSRHAQKGTIGCIVDAEDLPFSVSTGVMPDIVMSPLGITSRMTMGKIIEMVLGKAAMVTGDLLDSLDDQDFETPIEVRMDTVSRILRQAGFSSSGKEMFIDGTTGEMVQIPIMCGLVSYAKLNHMVARKAHARSTGPVHLLTRQPNEGRRQGGGLRFGPMEAECVIAHSASEILRERTLTAADPFLCYVCGQCGFMSDGNPDLGYYFCRVCKTGRFVRGVEMGHTTKLMVQELNATGIKVKFSLDDV